MAQSGISISVNGGRDADAVNGGNHADVDVFVFVFDGDGDLSSVSQLNFIYSIPHTGPRRMRIGKIPRIPARIPSGPNTTSISPSRTNG